MLHSATVILFVSMLCVPQLLRNQAQACVPVRPSSIPSTSTAAPSKFTTTSRPTTTTTTNSRTTTTVATATTTAVARTTTTVILPPLTTSTTTSAPTSTTTTTTTTTTTPTTTTTTTTTTTPPPSCTSCSTNNPLMQTSIGGDGMNRDGRADINVSVVNGCEVATATCFADGNRDTLIQVFTGGVPYIMNGGCGSADLPPNLITCNADGNWVFAVTGEINPSIQCSVTLIGPDC